MTGILMLPVAVLKAWPRNARLHTNEQVKQLAQSIRRFGFTHPILIDEDDRILSGHGRVRAARQLGLSEVPCLRLDHLSPAEKRAYVVADNKLALNAEWDQKLLAEELSGLIDDELLFETGFSLVEADGLIIDKPAEARDRPKASGPSHKRCRAGDIWRLGSNWLVCGDALKPDLVNTMIAGQQVQMLIARPAGATTRKDRDWAAATFLTAAKSGRGAMMSESDAGRCDGIIQRWEAQTKTAAYRFNTESGKDSTEARA
ncbi:MAG: ParB/Srx family N-terminal domain-containing protein [Pseudomonadota bacterium]